MTISGAGNKIATKLGIKFGKNAGTSSEGKNGIVSDRFTRNGKAEKLDADMMKEMGNVSAKEGSITKGLILAGVSAGLIGVASVGLPGVGAVGPGLLNCALRFAGVISIANGGEQIEQGNKNTALRGVLLTGLGAVSIAGAVGVFGPIGGLTALALGVGGFFGGVLSGIDKLS
ncbi:MAG: hypothetical protein K8T10_04610 [Candidatus Eremiobacteraeota bacterium]|nr:hypothetical protein [Candidatus Eremiobacteraeota bacterium]